MGKRVAPPATDEQLAAAERTENIRRRDREAANADIAEQERLALAGEPESEAQIALRAMASVADSTPVRAEEPDDDAPRDERNNESPPPPINHRRVQRNKSRRSTTNGKVARETIHRPIATPKPPPPQEKEPDPEAETRKAYRLMDLAYRKWGTAAKKDLRKANRDLAIDLGKDAMLYLRRGIIRMTDLHAAIEKLTATKAGEKDPSEDPEDFEAELETMRAALRGSNHVKG